MTAQVSIHSFEGELWDPFWMLLCIVSWANCPEGGSMVWRSSSVLKHQTCGCSGSQCMAKSLDSVSWSPAGVSPSLGYSQPSAWTVALGTFPPIALLDVTLALLLPVFPTGSIHRIRSLATSVDILFHSHLVASDQVSSHVLILQLWTQLCWAQQHTSEVLSFAVVGCLLLEIACPGCPCIVSIWDLLTSHLSLCLSIPCWVCMSIHGVSNSSSQHSSLIHLSSSLCLQCLCMQTTHFPG